ncbi:Hypothetical protein NocV09_01300980 [Nannochloropsis oceanica]
MIHDPIPYFQGFHDSGWWQSRRYGPGGKKGWLVCFLKLSAIGIVLSFVLGQCGVVLRNPAPICAWRLSKSWSVAWADTQASHHLMVLYLNEGEEFKLESESLPYARFFSFQTYSFLGDTSHGIIRDVDIVSRNGPNVYNNITAAMRGEKQGGYTLHLTADGFVGEYPNELRALAHGRRSGFFVLVFRMYDVGDVPHPRAPWAQLLRGSVRRPERWGWTSPPRLLVRRIRRQGPSPWREIPLCTERENESKKGFIENLIFNILFRLESFLPSIHSYTGFIRPLRKNNFHLQLGSLFDTPDTRTLVSAAANIPAVAEQGDLWARVSTKLPRTPRSLYAAPFVANTSAYDVRYVSFTSASRAFPLRTFETLTDKDIRQHHQDQLQGSREKWDGRFVLWVGPARAPIPEQARGEKALIMTWGTGADHALLYNQLNSMSHTMLDRAQSHSALANVVVEECFPFKERDDDGEEEKDKDEDEDEIRNNNVVSQSTSRETVCCLSKAERMPTFCRMPEFLHLNLREFFPAIDYFVHQQEEGQEQPSVLRKISF